MAYAVERYAEFKDYSGADWIIQILKKNYVGSETTFELGGDGFLLKYNGEGEDIDHAIKSSEVTFEFMSQSSTDDTFITSLVNADEGDYLVHIKNDDNNDTFYANYWKGVLIVDSAQLANDYYPQSFKLRAIDGISLLKGKQVTELTNIWDVDADGATGGAIVDFDTLVDGNETYGGHVYTHRSLLLACIRLIPTVELFSTTQTFVHNLSCWENTKMTNQLNVRYDPLWGVASRADSLYQSSNDGTFKYMNCYDVLKSILEYYNIRLFMAAPGGFWQTIQVGSYHRMKTANENYVRYDKEDYGKTYAGSGTVTYNIGNLSTSGDTMHDKYQIAESSFDYKKQIKEVEINVQANSQNIIDIGNTWQTNQNYNLTTTNTPSASDYIQTYSQVTAGQNMTFKLIIRGFIERQSAGVVDPLVIYFVQVFAFVKVGNYYLYRDGTQYKWSTTVQSTHLSNNSGMHLIPEVNGDNTSWQLNIGHTSTDIMDPVPVDGQVEFYVHYTQMIYNQGLTYADTTLVGNINVYTAQNYNYGYTSNAIEFNIYKNGSSYINSNYIVQNKPGGTLVNGGLEVQRETQFYNGNGYMNSSIFTWDGTNGTMGTNWNLDFAPRWRNRHEVNAASILPVFKGIEIIGLNPGNIKTLQATFYLKKTTPYHLAFNAMFEYEGEYWIPNGYTYYANENKVVGEWISIDYDIGNAISLTPFDIGGTFADSTESETGDVGFELF